LKLNEKNKNGNYPLLFSCFQNNIEMIKLLVSYANKNDTILELNEKIMREIILLQMLAIIIALKWLKYSSIMLILIILFWN